MSALRAACLTTLGTQIPVTPESPAPAGRLLDGVCVTADRDDPTRRVMHVATVRDVAARDRWYRVRVWHELSAVSAN